MKHLILWVLVGLTLFFQSSQAEEYYFRFQITDRTELDALTRIISIDKVVGDTVYAYANEQEWAAFQEKGYQTERLPHPGSLFEHRMASSLEGLRDWDTYPTYDAYVNMMQQYADSFPNLCRLDTFGYSVQGRMLLVMKISDNVNQEEDEPEFLYTSTMHGDETVGYVLLLRLIDYLLTQYGQDTPEGRRVTRLVDNMEIWINPLFNPDGTYHGGNYTVTGATRYNANGVDLNRNFPDRISDPVNTPAGREPETAAMMQLVAENNFNLSANFHGGAQVVNYPWDNGAPSGSYSACPDDAWFIHLSLVYATPNPDMLSGGFPNGITNGCQWYAIFGGRQDWIYYWHGGRETTIELWNTKNPPGSVLPGRWTNNKESLLAYMEEAFTGIRGLVTDAQTGEPIWAQIDIASIPGVPVFTDPDVGDFHRLLLPGNYQVIVRAPHYQPDTLFNVSVVDTGATRVNIALQPQPSNRVAGQVVLTDTNYFGGVSVTIENETVLTNASGYFEFPRVFGGPLVIYFYKDGYRQVVIDTTFDAQQPLWVEATLSPSRYTVLLIDDDSGERGGIAANPPAPDKENNGSVPVELSYQRGQSADLIETALVNTGYQVVRQLSGQTNPGTWSDYAMLIWSSGANTSPISTISLQQGLLNYAQSGKPLIIEGGEIGYDFRNNANFRNQVLHFSNWTTDNAGNLVVQNPSHPITQGLPGTIPLTYSGYGDQDAVIPASGAQLLIRNSNQSGTAGLLLYNEHVFMAFNAAAINSADAQQLFTNCANYFLPQTSPGIDVALYEIENLSSGQFVQAGTSQLLVVTLHNYGTQGIAAGIPVTVSVLDSALQVVYSTQTTTADSLPPGSSLTLPVASWSVPDTAGQFYITANVEAPDDPVTGNNSRAEMLITLPATTLLAENFEQWPDSLPWQIISLDDDSTNSSWHHSYLPALGRYSLRVNPAPSSHGQDDWLISPPLAGAEKLYFYWDYGADIITDTLLILASTNDSAVASFSDTLLVLNQSTASTNHFSHFQEVDLSIVNGPVNYIAFVYRGSAGHYWAVDNIFVSSTPTGMDATPRLAPTAFNLFQNYPNPFNPLTTIRYTLPRASRVQLSVYNVLGEKVQELVQEFQPAGVYSFRFDARDLPSGVYFYELKAGEYRAVRKMLLVK